jgi:hypothetical protein
MEQVYGEVCGEAYENFVGKFMRPFRTKKGVTDATPFISL